MKPSMINDRPLDSFELADVNAIHTEGGTNAAPGKPNPALLLMMHGQVLSFAPGVGWYVWDKQTGLVSAHAPTFMALKIEVCRRGAAYVRGALLAAVGSNIGSHDEHT